jgi:hypothetical protein
MLVVSKSRFFTSVTLLLLATIVFGSLSISARSARADKPSLKSNSRLSDYINPQQQNDILSRQQKINFNLNSPLSKDSNYTIRDCIGNDNITTNSSFIQDKNSKYYGIGTSLQISKLKEENCFKGRPAYSN